MKRSKLCLLVLCLTAPVWAHGDGEGPPSAALKRIFPAAESFVTRPVNFTAAVQQKISSRLGKPLEGHDLKSNAYIPTAKGQSLGVVWGTDAHLKEGLVDVLVGLDRQGKVVGVALDHSPVASLAQSSYLNRYKGLTAAASFQVKPLSGNPAASQVVSQAVRKSAVVIQEAFLGGKK